jgi:hypothetical protein
MISTVQRSARDVKGEKGKSDRSEPMECAFNEVMILEGLARDSKPVFWELGHFWQILGRLELDPEGVKGLSRGF